MRPEQSQHRRHAAFSKMIDEIANGRRHPLCGDQIGDQLREVPALREIIHGLRNPFALAATTTLFLHLIPIVRGNVHTYDERFRL